MLGFQNKGFRNHVCSFTLKYIVTGSALEGNSAGDGQGFKNNVEGNSCRHTFIFLLLLTAYVHFCCFAFFRFANINLEKVKCY